MVCLCVWIRLCVSMFLVWCACKCDLSCGVGVSCVCVRLCLSVVLVWCACV